MTFEFIALIVGFIASLMTIIALTISTVKWVIKKLSALSANRTDSPTNK